MPLTKRSTQYKYPWNRVKNFITPFGWPLPLIFFSVTILYFRRPDAFLLPQLWAEDGLHWMVPALNSPFSSIFDPYAGSLQLAMMLAGLIASFLPLVFTPTIFLIFAISAKVLPVVVAHSKRFRTVFKNRALLWALTIFYLLQPNMWEIHANLTNINWHLALLAFLVLAAPDVRSRAWKWFDRLALFIACLTGPFALFLLPISIIIYLQKKTKSSIEKLIIVSVCASIQLVTLFGMKNAGSLDLSAIFTHTKLLLQAIGTQISGANVIGGEAIGSSPLSQNVSILFGVLALLIMFLGIILGNNNLRLFIMFSLIILTASLLRTQTDDLVQLWTNFASGDGDRYFFIPSLAWFSALLYIMRYPNIILRSFSLLIISCIALFAIPADFTYSERKDTGYYQYVEELNSSSSGTVLCHEPNPITPNDAWKFCLEKK